MIASSSFCRVCGGLRAPWRATPRTPTIWCRSRRSAPSRTPGNSVRITPWRAGCSASCATPGSTRAAAGAGAIAARARRARRAVGDPAADCRPGAALPAECPVATAGGATPRRCPGPRGGFLLQRGCRDHGRTRGNADQPFGARTRGAAIHVVRDFRSAVVTLPDEVLMAYADDELDARARAAVEAAMAADPRDRAAGSRNTRRCAAGSTPPSTRFSTSRCPRACCRWCAASRPGPAQTSRAAARAAGAAPGVAAWTAMAASLIVGVIAGRLALVRLRHGPRSVMRAARSWRAAPWRTRCRISSLPISPPPARCRSVSAFARNRVNTAGRSPVRQTAALAGLACRAADGWQVRVLAGTESPAAASGPYRQAASSMPPAVITAVGDLMPASRSMRGRSPPRAGSTGSPERAAAPAANSRDPMR